MPPCLPYGLPEHMEAHSAFGGLPHVQDAAVIPGFPAERLHTPGHQIIVGVLSSSP